MRLFSLGVLPKTPMTCVILDASTSGLFREEATGGESQAFWQEQEHWVGIYELRISIYLIISL